MATVLSGCGSMKIVFYWHNSFHKVGRSVHLPRIWATFVIALSVALLSAFSQCSGYLILYFPFARNYSVKCFSLCFIVFLYEYVIIISSSIKCFELNYCALYREKVSCVTFSSDRSYIVLKNK